MSRTSRGKKPRRHLRVGAWGFVQERDLNRNIDLVIIAEKPQKRAINTEWTRVLGKAAAQKVESCVKLTSPLEWYES
jgi:hypothetical protein